VIGCVACLGGGACVVLGGLVYLGAKAEAEADDPVFDPSLAPGVSSTANEPPPFPPEMADEDTNDNGAGDEDEDDDDPAADDPSVAAKGTSSGAANPSTPKTAGGVKWSCNATGWVRVCGFANVCNNQMVSGIGMGSDRFGAQMMAKNACENMARAKGGSTVCTVSCSPRPG